MSAVILGAVVAAGAAIVYDVGVALQALEARITPTEQAWRPGLIAGLLRRRRWVAGTALGVLGWPLHAGALLLAPLTVVQPALAVGLIALLIIGARRLGERITRAEVGAVIAIIAGVLALVVGAGTGHPTLHQGSAVPIALGALAAVIAGLWTAVRARLGWWRCAPILAGLCFGFSGLSTQLVVDAADGGHVTPALLWTAATAAAAALGLLAETTALQRAAATRVAPTVFVIQLVVPVALGPLVTVGAIAHGLTGGVLVALGLGLVLAAVASLLRGSTAVATILEDGAPRSGREAITAAG